jgi:hypothetical protein
MMASDVLHNSPALAAPDSSSAPPVWRPIIQNCACFLAALASTCLAFCSFMPFWRAPRVYPKWQYFADHRDQFDTLFIGSSLIASHVIPRQFDAELAASGVPTKSFNLGSAGMFAPESYYVLRSVLQLRPAHLRRVFIDAMDINTRSSDQVLTTIRGIYWHDARQTQFAFRAIWESNRPIADKVYSWWAHGYAFAIRTVNSGRGAEWLSRIFSSSAIAEPPPEWIPVAGFEPAQSGALTGVALADFEQS